MKSEKLRSPKSCNGGVTYKALPLFFFLQYAISFSYNLSAQFITERPDWAGMWVNTGYKTDINLLGMENTIAGEAGRLAWGEMEATKGSFNFNKLKMGLERANNAGYYHYFVFWTGPSSPKWIYDPNIVGDNTVPKVFTDTSSETFPYYLDSDYKTYIKAFVDTLAGTLASWPQTIVDRLAFIQPGFGSTGDRQLYKGTPTVAQYRISDAEYVAFMQEMTIAFTTSFASRPKLSKIRFLWNIDDYDGDPEIPNPNEEEIYGKWMKENYVCQLRKQQYTIAVGYLNPNEVNQDNEQRDNFYGKTGRWGGNPEYVRGEFNEYETALTPLYQLNPKLFYYWTAISSVDRGLDSWEVKYNYLSQDYQEAYEFSHRYAFHKKAETSPYAFVALRDILDYSDISRFPEAQYGTATQGNQTRINNILAQYSSYGAKNEDMSAAVSYGGITYLKNVTGYNDCLWNVIARNNQRFISQIEANETSSGYWRVGVTADQPYGRFCRGFDVTKGKNTMYFDVDDQYFAINRANQDGYLKIKIIHYAKDGGSWRLSYHAQDGSIKTALDVVNDPSQDWVLTEVTLSDAMLNNGGPNGADLILSNTGATNCRFHLIELERHVNTTNVVDHKEILDALVKIYPNPASNTINIELAPTEAINQIKLFNTCGQLLYSRQSNNLKEQIDLSALNVKGMVLVQVTSSNALINKKIIVL